jgi:hypothetical protein
LPSIIDPEGCGNLKLTIEPTSLNTFITYDKGLNKLIIAPTKSFQIGKHNVTLVLSDSLNLNSTFNFTLTIADYPKFSGSLRSPQTIRVGSVVTYSLPIIEDDVITVTNLPPLPNFIKFSYRTYTFKPTKKSEIGFYQIKGYMKTQFGLLRTFSFRLVVINDPPFFPVLSLSSISLKQLQSKTLALPIP